MTNEEAIKRLKEARSTIQPFRYVDEAIDYAIKALEQQPKIGRWILDETDNSITCDKCDCLIWANDISNGDARYCPNCGAKMEVG